jgi:cytochrome c peroxidase
MGFNDQEIVALSGAHAMGRCHTDRSGFDGPWSFSPITFSNEYFRLLLEDKVSKRRVYHVLDNAERSIQWQFRAWEGPKQYENKSTKTLMMLPTDFALIEDKKFRPWVQKWVNFWFFRPKLLMWSRQFRYAKDENLFFDDFTKAFTKWVKFVPFG